MATLGSLTALYQDCGVFYAEKHRSTDKATVVQQLELHPLYQMKPW